MRTTVASASSIVEKLAQSCSHVRMNIYRQKHPSSRKDNPKSVTYSDTRTEFARAASDFESDPALFSEPRRDCIKIHLRKSVKSTEGKAERMQMLCRLPLAQSRLRKYFTDYPATR